MQVPPQQHAASNGQRRAALPDGSSCRRKGTDARLRVLSLLGLPGLGGRSSAAAERQLKPQPMDIL